jgi:hypothetical protein
VRKVTLPSAPTRHTGRNRKACGEEGSAGSRLYRQARHDPGLIPQANRAKVRTYAAAMKTHGAREADPVECNGNGLFFVPGTPVGSLACAEVAVK